MCGCVTGSHVVCEVVVVVGRIHEWVGEWVSGWVSRSEGWGDLRGGADAEPHRGSLQVDHIPSDTGGETAGIRAVHAPREHLGVRGKRKPDKRRALRGDVA